MTPFHTLRLASRHGTSSSFHAQLGGYRDEYDEALYATARARFVHQLQLTTGWRCAIDAGGALMCSTAAVESVE